jgi:hypothetical protein
VVAEAFNIGLRVSNPEQVGDLIHESLGKDLKHVSYVDLNVGRLYLMGGNSDAWAKGKTLLCKGMETLESEPPTVRWYDHSWMELASALHTMPDLLDMCSGRLRRMMQGAPDIQQFARKFGHQMTQVLASQGRLAEFIEPQQDNEDAVKQAILAELERRMAKEDSEE